MDAAVFIGHSDCYGVSTRIIEEAIIDLIENNVTVFMSGGQGGFDRMCAGCVYRLKREYPQIINCLVIPYLTFNIFDKTLFDEILYPEGLEKYHYKAAIPARNKFMVDNASYAICYINHGWGGAAQTYQRALKKKLNVTNLGTYGG